MKYAIYPHVWEEATAVIDVAGHERVAKWGLLEPVVRVVGTTVGRSWY